MKKRKDISLGTFLIASSFNFVLIWEATADMVPYAEYEVPRSNAIAEKSNPMMLGKFL